MPQTTPALSKADLLRQQARRRFETVKAEAERPLTAAPVADTDSNETDIPPTWRQRLVQADHLDRARLLAYCSRLFTAINGRPVV